MKKLIHENSEILHQSCNKINFSNPQIDINELEGDLIKCMEYYNGVGLSANQIGYPYKVFSLLHENEPLTLYNPRVLELSDEFVSEIEGCLTYPGLFVNIKRPKSLSIQWQDKHGEEHQGYFNKLSARIILHEMDHMNGNVFYDIASSFHLRQAKQKRKIHLRKMKKQKNVLYENYIQNKGIYVS